MSKRPEFLPSPPPGPQSIHSRPSQLSNRSPVISNPQQSTAPRRDLSTPSPGPHTAFPCVCVPVPPKNPAPVSTPPLSLVPDDPRRSFPLRRRPGIFDTAPNPAILRHLAPWMRGFARGNKSAKRALNSTWLKMPCCRPFPFMLKMPSIALAYATSPQAGFCKPPFDLPQSLAAPPDGKRLIKGEGDHRSFLPDSHFYAAALPSWLVSCSSYFPANKTTRCSPHRDRVGEFPQMMLGIWTS